MYLVKLISFLIICSSFLAGQAPGAREIALSNSDVALCNDAFALYSNPAGLSQLGWREIGVYYSPAPFGLKELANAYLVYNELTPIGTFTFGAMTYGFELYRENKISLSFSKRFEKKFFAGIVVNYNFLKIQNYGSDNSFTLDAGGLAYILPNLRWGFSIHNFTRATYGSEKNQIPEIFNTGLSYNPTDYASINAAIEKDASYKASLRFGLEYYLIKNISLRFGLSTQPDKYSAGLGIIYSIIQLDYAVVNHPELGLTHQVGLIFNFSGDDIRSTQINKFLSF